MKDLLVKDIVAVTQGKLLWGDENIVFKNVTKDSREVNAGDVYLGIKGERVNGSTFYKDAFAKGAIGAIVQEIEISKEDMEAFPDKFIIMVDDVVKALQEIAKLKRSLVDIPVIGITGSVGKTSTKDLVASVLAQKYKVLKTQGNYNNEIGLPLTVLSLKDEEMMVLEMGMSALGEISLLTDIAQPSTGVITVIGSSHIGELGSRENILKAKLEILEGLEPEGKLIFNNDNDLLHKWSQENTDVHVHVTYGIENTSNLMATNISVKENSTEYDVEVEGTTYHITVPIGGNHFVYNSLAAVAVGLEYGVPMEDIIKGIAEFALTKRRMEVSKNSKGATIINDSYNASYESVKAALEYIHSISANKRIAVLGDVLELGEFSKQMHEKMGEEVLNNQIDVLVTVGPEATHIAEKCKELGMNQENIYHFDTNEEAVKLLNNMMEKDDVVLVKASNGMHFDEIVEKII